MAKTIGIFVGNITNFNTRQVIANHGWMLGDIFNLDLIATNPGVYDTSAYEGVFGREAPGTHLGAIKALYEYIKEREPDVLLHTNRPQTHGNVTAILGNESGITKIYRYAGDTFNLYKVAEGWKKAPYFLMNNLIGRVPLSYSDQFITLGPHGQNQLISRGVAQNSITILPPSIDTTRLQRDIPIELPVADGRSVVLFVGRRSHLKGIKFIQNTIPRILAQRSDFHFVFVGKGPNVNLGQSLDKHITVIGEVEPSRIPGYFQVADVLILPSLIEGIPRVILEALASETPVIARDVGDISYVTRNTFTTEKEFVDLLCSFEDLSIDSYDEFDRANLKNTYIDYYSKL